MTSPHLISVRPPWASAFFLKRNPKIIELRKGSFGVCLKSGDSIVIYATKPNAELIGIVRFVKCEILPLPQLWQASEQGKLAKVSKAQFDAYYLNKSLGIGVWVEDAQLLPKPIPLHRLRKFWGERWNPPQQIQKLSESQKMLIG